MTTDNVIAWPGSPAHREAQAQELDRLRALAATVARPVIEVAAELEYLRGVASAAVEAMGKVAEHDSKGYEHIRIGAFTALRTALAEEPTDR